MEAQREIFEDVFQEHLREVQRLIALHTRDPEDRLDLTQEVFIRAYSAFSQFRGESSVSTWLYRIAINVCANAARSRERHHEQPLADDDPHDYPDGLREVVDDLAHAEEQKMLKQALRSLSAEQLLALSLRFSDQLSLPEIAEVVGAPVDTVKSRLRTALDRIQGTLAYLHVDVARNQRVPLFDEAFDVSLDRMSVEGEKGAKIYHSLGSLYLRKGLIEAALMEWRKAQEVDPTFVDAYLASARQYVSMDDPRRAVDTLETAVGKVQSSDLHTTLAQLYVDFGDIHEGMTHSQRAIELDPDSAEAHYAAGRAYCKGAELQEALRSLLVNGGAAPESSVEASWRRSASHFEQAIRLKPEFARAKSSLALAYMMDSMPGRAIRQIRAAAESSPKDDLVLHQASWIHYRAGKLALAERYLRDSVGIKASAEKLGLLGLVYLASNRCEEAFVALNEALSLATDKKARAQIYANLAATAVRLERPEEAIEAAEAALELDANQVHARCNMAEAHLKSGDDLQKVVDVCREGLRLSPGHVCFHHLLAEALFRLERFEEALQEATTAIELEPGACARWLLRAGILTKLDRPEAARRDLCAALDLDPRNEEAAKALEGLGERATAVGLAG